MKFALAMLTVIAGLSAHAEDRRFVWAQGGGDSTLCGDTQKGFVVDDSYCSYKPKPGYYTIYGLPGKDGDPALKADADRASARGLRLANNFAERFPLIDKGDRTISAFEMLIDDREGLAFLGDDVEKIVRISAARANLKLSIKVRTDWPYRQNHRLIDFTVTGRQVDILDFDKSIDRFRTKLYSPGKEEASGRAEKAPEAGA